MDALAERKAFENRVVRKIDWHIMPWIVISYLLNYLDRTNLGNARTLNSDKPGESLVESLSLQGDRYNFIVAIFFVPYVIFEFPSNLLLKRFTPSKWIGRIMVSWGIVTCCTAAVTTYQGLIAVRIFLGITEAGFFPAVIYLLCFWYPPHQRATRMAIFSASVAVSGAFGGLIATGISFMSGLGGLYGWQWLFILEGIPSVIVGVLVFFFLPDYPETAKWLNDEEREWAVERMGQFAPKGTDKHFDKDEFISTLISPMFWIFACMYFFLTNSLNAFGYFSPLLIKEMGFTGYKGQLMTVPPNIFAFFVIIGNSWHSDRTRERPFHIIAGILFVAVGYVLLAACKNVAGRYTGVFMIACTNSAVIPFLAYRTATVSGATASAIATGGIIALANCAGAVAPYLFRAKDAPHYYPGLWTLFAMLGASVFITLYLRYKLGGSSEYRNVTIVDAPVRGDDSELPLELDGEDVDKKGEGKTKVSVLAKESV